MKITLKRNLTDKEIRQKNIVPVVFNNKKQIEVIQTPEKTRVLSFGVGKREDMTLRKCISLARRIIAIAKSHKCKRIHISFEDFLFPKLKNISEEELVSLLIQNFYMANFEFTKFKTKPKEGWNSIEEIIITGNATSSLKKGIEQGKIIGEEVNNCRILSNTPGGDMTPNILANEAKRACKGTGVSVRVLDKKAMQKLKMGAVLGVAQGSKEEPRFIILEYKKGKKKDAPIVLVGKGVTFDTGGINLKPSNAVLDMHMDMSGGAAVIHAVVAAARLKLPRNVIGLIPAVENMPGGEAYRPGDILKSMSGKSIEILNTDAEGRVILADALTYAKRYKPQLVVDVATLTGAAVVALGQRASALMTKEERLEKQFMKLAESTGDYLWPLPLWEEYEDDVMGNFADVANVPASGSGGGGAINGGVFLYQFVKDPQEKSGQAYPWVHLDIAPRMVSSRGDYLAKGAVGTPVRLLVKLLRTL